MDILKNNIFIERSVKVHGDKYDYSLVNYINNETKIKIICHVHGIFEQEPRKHINRAQKCPKCTGHKTDTESFILKAKQLHGNEYDYSQVSYQSAHEKVKIICPIHGNFKQTPNAHLAGKKCYKCTGTPKKTTEEFVCDAKKKHGNKYDYSLVTYIDNSVKIDIICKRHGLFKQTPAAHLRGSGCPICRDSKGEIAVREYLNKNNVLFIRQKRFNDCRYILPLPFDFYLPEYNTCIEFQGIQHYLSSYTFGSKKGTNEFEKLQLRDKIKSDYCLGNNIRLLIISYKDNIDVALSNFFNTNILETTT